MNKYRVTYATGEYSYEKHSDTFKTVTVEADTFGTTGNVNVPVNDDGTFTAFFYKADSLFAVYSNVRVLRQT